DRQAGRHEIRVEADEYRLVEQVGVVIELADFEHDVAVARGAVPATGRHAGDVRNIEHQITFFADAYVEILRDLRIAQHAIVHRQHLDHAGPRCTARGVAAKENVVTGRPIDA